MQISFKTDKGKHRNNNEDSFFVNESNRFFIICDGVGGGNSGEVASRIAVDTISNFLKEKKIYDLTEKEDIISLFSEAISLANEEIYSSAISNINNKGMATTLILFYIFNKTAYIANIGDSRVYIFRKNSLTQLTEDHTYVNTLVKAGILTKKQAENDSRKNMIIKALGAEPIIEPDYFMVDIKIDDVFILCTDGLYDEVSNREISKNIRENVEMSSLCDKLILCANNNGGHDNITIICAKVLEDDVNE